MPISSAKLARLIPVAQNAYGYVVWDPIAAVLQYSHTPEVWGEVHGFLDLKTDEFTALREYLRTGAKVPLSDIADRSG